MELAEAMYEAYRKSLFRVGVVVARWDLIGEDDREAWHAAASRAGEVLCSS